jgi:multiple sugar transport system substrate-binding protein
MRGDWGMIAMAADTSAISGCKRGCGASLGSEMLPTVVNLAMSPNRLLTRLGDSSRLRVTVAITAALALLLCQRPAAAAPLEISYWTGWSGHELAIQRRLVEKFEAQHPGLKVHIMTVAGSYEKVTLSFAAGNPPDLMSSVWTEDLASFAMRGAIRPLDNYMRRSGRDLDREYIPGIARAMSYSDRTWGLMVTVNSGFLLANRKLMLDAGLDPDHPPQTTAELDAVNEKLVKYDKAGNLMRFGWRPAPLQLYAHIFGGTWYDAANRKVTANHPKNIEALNYLCEYGRKYDPRKLRAFEDALSGTNLGYASDIGNFYGLFNGFSVILPTGEYCQEFIDRYAPKDFQYVFFTYPSPPGGRANSFSLGGSVFVIPRDARHPDEAWQLLDFLSSPAAVKEFCVGIRNMPPLRELLDDDEFTSSPIQCFAGKLLLSENAFAPPPMPIWSYYMAQIARAQEAAIMGGDPRQLLDAVQNDVQEKLDKALQYAVN